MSAPDRNLENESYMGYRKTACRCRPFFYADGGTRTRMPEKGGGFSCCTMLPWPKDRCSLDYVLTMPGGLGRWYIVSTHFRKTCLARRCPCGISAELASIHAGGFPARCSNDLSPLCLPFHHSGANGHIIANQSESCARLSPKTVA